MKVGVISDTHVPDRAPKLPDWLFSELEGCEYLLHAGDVTNKDTLEKLNTIAPVKAVSGNCDVHLSQELPDSRQLTLADTKIAIYHGHRIRGEVITGLQYKFPEADIIIFGHTHDAFHKEIEGQHFINPGSPTSRKHKKYYSAVIMEVKNGLVDIDFIKKYN